MDSPTPEWIRTADTRVVAEYVLTLAEHEREALISALVCGSDYEWGSDLDVRTYPALMIRLRKLAPNTPPADDVRAAVEPRLTVTLTADEIDVVRTAMRNLAADTGIPDDVDILEALRNAETSTSPADTLGSNEQCCYCGKAFPRPVSLHHSEDECTPPADDVREACQQPSVGWHYDHKWEVHQGWAKCTLCGLEDEDLKWEPSSSPPADVREALRDIVRGGSYSRFPDDLPYADVVDRILAAFEVRPHGAVAATVENLRFVNAAVVLAALAQMEEVAADRQQLQSVKLSILRRRIASLQRQIENQAAEVHPHGTVTDAERWAINGALATGLPMWTSKLEEDHARKALLDRIVRALEAEREARS